MADFEKAIIRLLIKEGGAKIVNDPDDPGGLTKYGISQRSYPNLDIASITEAQAKEVYKRDYWDKLDLDFEANQDIAGNLFESAVNMGVSVAKRLNAAVKLKRELSDYEIWELQFKTLEVLRYLAIVNNRKASRKYLRGWLNRIFSEN